jgi:hypothetical protein
MGISSIDLLLLVEVIIISSRFVSEGDNPTSIVSALLSGKTNELVLVW